MRYITLLTIAIVLNSFTVGAQHAAPQDIQATTITEAHKAPPANSASATIVVSSIYIKDKAQRQAEDLEAAKMGLGQKPVSYAVDMRNAPVAAANPIAIAAREPHTAEIAAVDEKDRACVRALNMARKDNYNKELKYYIFGLPAGDFPHDIKRELLKEKYNLNYVMMGCVVDDTLQCYNREAEKILFRKYGKDFWQKVDEEVDKAANNTGFGPRNGYGRGEEVRPSDR